MKAQFSLPLMVLLCVTGCATPEFARPVTTGAIDYNGQPLGEKTVFGPSDGQVTFVVKFKAAGLVLARYEVRWLSPDGLVYRTEEARLFRDRYFASLPIRGTTASGLPGNWTVQILDERSEVIRTFGFEITK